MTVPRCNLLVSSWGDWGGSSPSAGDIACDSPLWACRWQAQALVVVVVVYQYKLSVGKIVNTMYYYITNQNIHIDIAHLKFIEN